MILRCFPLKKFLPYVVETYNKRYAKNKKEDYYALKKYPL